MPIITHLMLRALMVSQEPPVPSRAQREQNVIPKVLSGTWGLAASVQTLKPSVFSLLGQRWHLSPPNLRHGMMRGAARWQRHWKLQQQHKKWRSVALTAHLKVPCVFLTAGLALLLETCSLVKKRAHALQSEWRWTPGLLFVLLAPPHTSVPNDSLVRGTAVPEPLGNGAGKARSTRQPPKRGTAATCGLGFDHNLFSL